MNSNSGKPSSTKVDPGVVCLATLRDGNVEEPFACPVNLDEERDAKVSDRPNIATRAAVEGRDDTSRKQAPSTAFRPSFGLISSHDAEPLPRANHGTASSLERLDDLSRKRAPKSQPNNAIQHSSSLFGSNTSSTVPKKQEEELSFPFVVDRHPTRSKVARLPNPNVNASASLSALLRDNQSVHHSTLPTKLDGQNLNYFAEIARRKKSLMSTSRTKAVSRPQIVNTPLGLAVLLNYSGSKPPPSNPKTTPRIPANTMQKGPTNQQSQPNAVASNFAQVGTDQDRKFQRWSEEEDMRLKIAIEKEGGFQHNWKRIASKYFSNSRTGLQCKSRWTKSLKPGIVRGPWTPEDDALIVKLKQEGLKWSQIAEYLPGRLAEHINDRYQNVLDPTLKKGPWTPEEDRILFQEQRRLGNKWTQISHLIPGRSENSVKNRWHNTKVTRQRRMRQGATLRKCRNEPGLEDSDIQQKRLLKMRLRLLQMEMANKSSIPTSDTNLVAAPEQNQLEDQIQSLRLGPTQSSAAPRSAAIEVIEILDDEDDD